MVADFERCKINEVWDMGVIQFVNYLTYLKLKDKRDADKYKQSTSGRN